MKKLNNVEIGIRFLILGKQTKQVILQIKLNTLLNYLSVPSLDTKIYFKAAEDFLILFLFEVFLSM